MKLRWCKPELDMFEECKHDPLVYAKFQELATPVQKTPKNYHSYLIHRDIN